MSERKRGLISFDFEVQEIENSVWERTEIQWGRKMSIRRRGWEERKRRRRRKEYLTFTCILLKPSGFFTFHQV